MQRKGVRGSAIVGIARCVTRPSLIVRRFKSSKSIAHSRPGVLHTHGRGSSTYVCCLNCTANIRSYPNYFLIPMGDNYILLSNQQPTQTHLQRVGLFLEKFVSTICSLQFALVNLLVHTSGRDLRHGFVIRFRGLMNY